MNLTSSGGARPKTLVAIFFGSLVSAQLYIGLLHTYIRTGKIITFAFHFSDFFWKSGRVIFSLFKSESESEKSEKIIFQKRK